MEKFKSLKPVEKIKIMISTFFFAGYSPVIPGTVGTAAGLIIYLPLARWAPLPVYIAVLLLTVAAGVWASGFAEKFYGRKDPSEAVIDEVAGFLLAMLFLTPGVYNIIAGFILFRVLDIIKPPPVRYFERMRGGVGIMADDLVAALYTNLAMHLLRFLTNLFHGGVAG